MAMEIMPIVGHWYQSLDSSRFEVIDVDENEGVVAIQYFEGELDEVEFDVWVDLGLTGIAPPEDWTGPFDITERDDLGYTDMNHRPERNPLLFDHFDNDS